MPPLMALLCCTVVVMLTERVSRIEMIRVPESCVVYSLV